MTIYLDVVLLENLCMNFIILFATGYIIKTKIKCWRLLCSSLLGGVYSVISYMEILPLYSSIFAKILLSIAMIYLAFSPKSIKTTLKQLLIFYLTSFVFGGCAFAMLYFLKPQDILMRNGVYVGTYPLKVALLGAIGGFVITYISFKVIKSKITKKDMLYDIKIKFNQKDIKIKAMLDTGNMLKDPITGIPVVIVEKEMLQDIFPEKILNNLEKIIGGDAEEILSDLQCQEYVSKFRIIPFKSVGKQNGLMLGFKADDILIMLEEPKSLNNVIVGIYNGNFTKNNTYSALIGLDILGGSDNSEYTANVKV